MSTGLQILLQAMQNQTARREKRVETYLKLAMQEQEQRRDAVKLLTQRQDKLRSDKYALHDLSAKAMAEDRRSQQNLAKTLGEIESERIRILQAAGRSVSTTTGGVSTTVRTGDGRRSDGGLTPEQQAWNEGNKKAVKQEVNRRIDTGDNKFKGEDVNAFVQNYGQHFGTLRDDAAQIARLNNPYATQGFTEGVSVNIRNTVVADLQRLDRAGMEGIKESLYNDVAREMKLPAGQMPTPDQVANHLVNRAGNAVLGALVGDLPRQSPATPSGEPQTSTSQTITGPRTTVTQKEFDVQGALAALGERERVARATVRDTAQDEAAIQAAAADNVLTEEELAAFTPEVRAAATTLLATEGKALEATEGSPFEVASDADLLKALREASTLGKASLETLANNYERAAEIGTRAATLRREEAALPEQDRRTGAQIRRDAVLEEFRARGGKRSINVSRLTKQISRVVADKKITDPAEAKAAQKQIIDNLGKAFGFKPRHYDRLYNRFGIDKPTDVNDYPQPPTPFDGESTLPSAQEMAVANAESDEAAVDAASAGTPAPAKVLEGGVLRDIQPGEAVDASGRLQGSTPTQTPPQPQAAPQTPSRAPESASPEAAALNKVEQSSMTVAEAPLDPSRVPLMGQEVIVDQGPQLPTEEATRTVGLPLADAPKGPFQGVAENLGQAGDAVMSNLRAIGSDFAGMVPSFGSAPADPLDELMAAEGLQASISHSGGVQGALGANNGMAGQAAGRAAAHGLLTSTSGRPELRAAHSEELANKSVDVYNLSNESRSTLFDPKRRSDLAEYARMARASNAEMDRSAVAKIVPGADKDPGLYAAAVHLANYDAEIA